MVATSRADTRGPYNWGHRPWKSRCDSPIPTATNNLVYIEINGRELQRTASGFRLICGLENARLVREGKFGLRIEPHAIVDGFNEVLTGAEILLGGLYGGVAEQELNLFEVAPRRTAEFRAGAPQVMRSEFFQAQGLGVFEHDPPDYLRRDSVAPKRSAFVNWAKNHAMHGHRRLSIVINRGRPKSRQISGMRVSSHLYWEGTNFPITPHRELRKFVAIVKRTANATVYPATG